MITVQFKTQNFSMMLKKFFGLLLFMLPIIITYNVVRTKKGLSSVFNLLIFSAILGSVYGIYTAIFHPFGGSVYRAYGAFVNPNGLGNYLLIIIPILITYIFPMQTGVKRVFYFIGSSFVFLCLLATKSRGAWLGVLSAMALMSLFHRQRLLIVIVICLLIIPVLTVPQLTDKLFSMVDFNNDSFMARYILWNEAVITIGSNPVFGEGLGTWVRSPVPYNVKKFDNAFNMFLTAGVGLGIPGMVILAWIFFAAMQKAFFLYRNINNLFWKSVTLGLLGSIFANLIHGLFEDPVYLIFTNWLIGMTIGLVYSIEDVIYKPQKDSMVKTHIERSV
jgi:O-antigen ligase